MWAADAPYDWSEVRPLPKIEVAERPTAEPSPTAEVINDLVQRMGDGSLTAKEALEEFLNRSPVFEPTPTPEAAQFAPAVVPVAVSERLPGEGDCDAEGRCWWFAGDWHLKQVRYRGAYDNHWLPFQAIPLPQAGEVQP
jgi:hypothetical protein